MIGARRALTQELQNTIKHHNRNSMANVDGKCSDGGCRQMAMAVVLGVATREVML
jgi:hypothetical protein